MGITNIDWCEREHQWWINRYWYKVGNLNTKTHKRVKISIIKAKRKYTKGKEYPAIVFSYNNKTVSIPLGRLIYCWFVGDIPYNMDIDHINNNPFDNTIENLQLLTREENLAKRFSDNPDCRVNQFR